MALDAAGDLYVSDTVNNRVVKVPADGGPQETVPATGLPARSDWRSTAPATSSSPTASTTGW